LPPTVAAGPALYPPESAKPVEVAQAQIPRSPSDYPRPRAGESVQSYKARLDAWGKGKQYDPEAQAAIAGAEQKARKAEDLAAAAPIRKAELGVDLDIKPQIAQKEAEAKPVGEAIGEARAKLGSMEAQLPALEQIAQKLSALGKTATYTGAGQAVDAATRQMGLPMRDAAVARAEYISTVDNEVLPLLRQTFGAAFTQKEGESLKVTLGDPNKSPEEKDAVLRSFIEAKKREVGSLQRQTGASPSAPEGWSVKRVK
jgi:hypothetical protein